MELLIAVFGLLFYGIAIAGDKAKSKTYEKKSNDRMSWHNARRDAWLSKVYSVAAVHEAQEYLEDIKSWVGILADAYMKLPSCSGLDKSAVLDIVYKNCARDSHDKRTKRNEYYKCLMWVLAQRGKIKDNWDAEISFIPAFTDREKLMWDIQYEFAMLILQEIRKVAPESRMIFTTPLGMDYEVAAYDAERDISQFRYRIGKMRWLHLTYFKDDLKLY